MRTIFLTCFVSSLMISSSVEVQFSDLKFTKSEWHRVIKAIHCWSHGKWVHSTTDPRVAKFKLQYSNICTEKYHDTFCELERNRTKFNRDYVWYNHESECLKSHSLIEDKFQYQAWNKEIMHKVLHGRNLVVVGDSMNAELHSTLMSAIIDTPGCRVCPYECYGEPVKVVDGAFSYTVSNVRDDGLMIVKRNRIEGSTFCFAAPFICKNFIRPMQEQNARLIIMNRGSHYRPDDELLEDLNSTFTYLKENFPETGILYRNTPPGHNCNMELTNAPLSEPELEDNLPYDWDKFSHQNELTRELIVNHFPNIVYVDVYSPTVLRIDMHRAPEDCLHYCIPGPVDTWVMLIYNALRLIFHDQLQLSS